MTTLEERMASAIRGEAAAQLGYIEADVDAIARAVVAVLPKSDVSDALCDAYTDPDEHYINLGVLRAALDGTQ